MWIWTAKYAKIKIVFQTVREESQKELNHALISCQDSSYALKRKAYSNRKQKVQLRWPDIQ